MEWNAGNYAQTCGRVTEHGMKLVDVLKEMQCEKILDIGCGTGTLTNELAKFAQEVIGIDLSSAMVEKAASEYPSLKFAVVDACSLPWEDYFDAVFSNAVFHFINAQDVLLENIHKALTQGGVLVAEFGASGNISALLDAVALACEKRGKPYSLRFYYPTTDDYAGILKRQGFTIESIITYDLDTRLIEGEPGLRNWVKQIFSVEMSWFHESEHEDVLKEIEDKLRPLQWDGENWHLPNRRIRVIARKDAGN
jgi:trans-aconitate methyltransferase